MYAHQLHCAERGLEDQLLAKTVGEERPDLEAETQRLNAEATQYKIQLLDLEDQLLERLANAPDDICRIFCSSEGLEATKKTSKEIQAALAEGAKVTAGIRRRARGVPASRRRRAAMLPPSCSRACAPWTSMRPARVGFLRDVLPEVHHAKATAAPEDRGPRRQSRSPVMMNDDLCRGWPADCFTRRHKLIFLSVITFGPGWGGVRLGEDNSDRSRAVRTSC